MMSATATSAVHAALRHPSDKTIEAVVLVLASESTIHPVMGGPHRGQPHLQWSQETLQHLFWQVLVGPARGWGDRTIVISEADAARIVAQAMVRQPRYAGQHVHLQRVSDVIVTEELRLAHYVKI